MRAGERGAGDGAAEAGWRVSELMVQVVLWIGVAAVLTLIMVEHLRGTVELFSMRNIALVGFLVFQWLGIPGFFETVDGSIGGAAFNIVDPEAAAGKMVMLSVSFVLIALVSYKVGGGAVRSFTGLLPAPPPPPGRGAIWAVMFGLLIAAAPLKFGVRVPFIGTLANLTGTGVCALTAGLAGWLVARKLTDLTVIVPCALVTLAALAISLYGEYSRRPIITVGAAFAAGLYFARFRYDPPAKTLTRLVAFGLPFMMLFGAFTSVRSQQLRYGNPVQLLIKTVTEGDPFYAFHSLADTYSTRITGWLIERDDNGLLESQSRPLFSMLYLVAFPVPRIAFEVFGAPKPYPLSTLISDIAYVKGITRGVGGATLPAGIIGNSVVEGGWYAIFVYGVFSGLLIRVGDEYIRRGVTNPFMALSVCTALGQVLGLARGEASVFAFIWIYTTASTAAICVVVGHVAKMVSPSLVLAADDEEPMDDGTRALSPAGRYGEYADYGRGDDPSAAPP